MLSNLDPTRVKKADEKGVQGQQQRLQDFAAEVGKMQTQFDAPVVSAPTPQQAALVQSQKIQQQNIATPAPISTGVAKVAPQQQTMLKPPQDMQATQVDRTSPAQAAGVENAAIAGVSSLGQATQLSPVQIAELQQIQASQLTRDDLQLRDQQLALSQALQQQAQGLGPSLAQSQLQQANEQAIKQQQALAASARGGQLQQAQRQAAINTAELQQQAAQQSAQLAMQEQLAARQQLGGVLDAARGQDISVDTTQTGFDQQAALASKSAEDARAMQQAQIDQQSGFKQADITETRALTQAEMEMRAELANQSAENQRLLSNAGFQQDINKLNKMSDDAYNTLVANFVNDAVKTNKLSQDQAAQIQADLDSRRLAQEQALQADLQKFNVSTALTRDQFNSENEYRTALANAQMQLDVKKQNALLNFQAQTANQQAQNEMARFAADAELRTDLANQAASLQAQGLSLQAISQQLGLQADTLKAVAQIEQSLFQAESQRQATISEKRSGVVGGLLNTAGGALSALLSDENKKQDIKQNDKKMDDFLAALNNYDFSYKHKPSETKAGVMAQDLEKTEAGAGAVKQLPDGTKVISIPDGLGLAFAAIAKLSKDIKGK